MYGGLAKFNGSNWITYNTSNSGLPSDNILSVAVDGNDVKWVGTSMDGIVKFDGVNWITYNTSNSGILDNTVFSIMFEGINKIWIKTLAGVEKFEGEKWSLLTSFNSGLPSENISSIAIDKNGNKWIGIIDVGLAVYNEGGVVLNPVDPNSGYGYQLMQNYPNPFNLETEFIYQVPITENISLKIYDISGRLVRTLANERKEAGSYTVRWNGKDNRGHVVPSGLYLYHLQTEHSTKTGKATLIR